MMARPLRFVGRFVAGIIIRRREGLPSLDRAPSWARVIARLAASGGLLLCLAICSLVVPSVIDASRSPHPWTPEGFWVLLIVACVGCDALRYGRLAISY